MNCRLNHFIRQCAGTSTAEYAIIIALIAAAIMLGSDALRLASESSFRRTTVALGAAPSPADSNGGASASNNSPAPTPDSLVAATPPIHAFAWGVLIAAAAIVAHSRYRRARCRRAVGEIVSSEESPPERPTNPNFKKRQDIQRTLLSYFDDVVRSRIEVRHVMSRKVRTAEQNAAVQEVRELMEAERFHHLLIMRGSTLIGVVSDRDLYNKRGRRVKDIMTPNPLTVGPGTNIAQAITSMLHARISCLPVVEEGRVQGILTTTDLLMSLQCLMQLLERQNAQSQPDSDVMPLRCAADAASELTSVAT